MISSNPLRESLAAIRHQVDHLYVKIWVSLKFQIHDGGDHGDLFAG